MNAHETRQERRFDKPVADNGIDRLPSDRGSLFGQRGAAVAAAAAAEADEVDHRARFPKAAIDGAREQKLLAMQIPVALGGPAKQRDMLGLSAHASADGHVEGWR